MDDSPIDPLYGGVDHYGPGECVVNKESGDIIPMQEDRYLDTSANTTEIRVQLEKFTEYFKLIEEYSQEKHTNFYVRHRPILGIRYNSSNIVTLDWTF